MSMSTKKIRPEAVPAVRMIKAGGDYDIKRKRNMYQGNTVNSKRLMMKSAKKWTSVAVTQKQMIGQNIIQIVPAKSKCKHIFLINFWV